MTAQGAGRTAGAPDDQGHVEEPASQARRWRARLDVRELAAQVCWITVFGPDSDRADPRNRHRLGVDTPAEAVSSLTPGGIVLFAWSGNCAHPRQLAALSRDLQEAAAQAGGGVPLAIASDEEGGRVARLPPPATRWPSARALARSPVSDAGARWSAGARELRACGIGLDLAPVVDVDAQANPVLGERAFGSDVATVVTHAQAAVQGLHDAGVASVAKHFPGHGATAVDSHLALPRCDASADALRSVHVAAFAELLAAAPPAGIMTGHLLAPALDPHEPATTSAAITTGLLREELGYDGLVLTDSLAMAALADRDPVETAVAALAAGADVLLTPPDPRAVVEGIVHAVERGRLPADRLEAAVDRVLRHKARWPAPHDPDGLAADAPEHRAHAARLASRAVHVDDPDHRLPLSCPLVVVGEPDGPARGLCDALRDRGATAELWELGARQAAGGLEDAGQARTEPGVRPPPTEGRVQPTDGAEGVQRLERHASSRGAQLVVATVPGSAPEGELQRLAQTNDVLRVDAGPPGPRGPAAVVVSGHGHDPTTLAAVAARIFSR